MHNKNTDSLFLSVEDVYSAIEKNQPNKKDAELLLGLRDWFINVCNFDPRTGQTSPLGFSTLFRNIMKLLSTEQVDLPKDRLSRIIDHSREALKSIIGKPRDKVLREHAMLPIYATHEVDSVSVQWLSRKPGRNLREKLAGKFYVKAVYRRMCLDTAENRLLKAFIVKLVRLLLVRDDALAGQLDESDAELLQLAQRWFQNDDVREIGSWSNLPPNNTLLQDKNYLKVWDAWLWLQALDENIMADHKRLGRDWETMLFWIIVAKLNNLEQIRFVEQPIYFEYDIYSIRLALDNPRCMFFHKAASNPRSIIIKLTSSAHLYFECGKNQMSFDTRQIPISERNISRANHIAEFIVGKILDGDYAKLKKRTEPLLAKQPKYNNVIIDIYGIRPRFVADSGTEQIIPFRFVKQYWNSDDFGSVAIDCGVANAVTLRPEVTTISMLSLLSESGDYPTGLLSDAAMAFTSKLKDLFKNSQKLTYLVPDSISEFSLENIRRNINFYFPESVPLPRSIAVVFAWQASDSFKKSRFKRGDCVLVLEVTGARVSITPLIGCKAKENDLQKAVPATKGFYWERHPSIVMKVNSPVDDLCKALQKNGCQIGEEIAEVWGRTGIEDDCSKLSWVDEKDNWYTFSSNPNLPDIRIKWADVLSAIKGIANKSLFLATIGEYSEQVQFDHLPKNVVNLRSPSSLVSGGQILRQWQLQAGDFPLWRDHLPQLLFKDIVYSKNGWGFWGHFELVKDTSITPQKGERVQIPVKESFTLPAGQPHYKFPLLQGAGGQELQYMAYLKSSAFPLSQDTVCSLIMTYTYGADDPYELKFIPNNPDDAGFKSVRVEWRELRHSEMAEGIFPGFPAHYEWRDFESFPGEDGKTSNLLTWIEKELHKIASIRRFIDDEIATDNDRLYDDDLSYLEWKKDRNENSFCIINYDDWGSVFIHETNYEQFDINAEAISFDLQSNRDREGYIARNITTGKTLPIDTVQRLRKSIRFPVFTVWNQAHALSEVEVPDWFRQSMQEGVEDALYLIGQDNIPQNLKDELFFFLSCLHKDTPKEVSLKLMQILEDSENNVKQLERYYRHIANAIGDCELEWQTSLLEKILFFIKSGDSYESSLGLQILSIAIWRTEQLVFRFSQTEIHLLVGNLFSSIEHGFNNVVKVSSRDNSIYVNPYEIMKIEFLLSLLRTRGSQDENIKRTLSPEREITKKFVTIIDNLTQKICDRKLDVWSRVSLQIDKPKGFHYTPDLLYALRMYLTGDSGANTIQVTGVSDED